MKYAIGIDLGTTYSAVSVLGSNGKPYIIPNQEGQNITPSVVMFPESDGREEPLVGEMAKHSIITSPLDVVQFVKRQMGDPHFKFESVNGHSFTAEEISAFIIKKLKQDAERYLNSQISDAIITVPAYFDDTRRMATIHAGKIAGLNVSVINEPTAAAIAYGINFEASGNVLVYDLGGGTFDVTVMRVFDGVFDVLSTDGNRNLGGFDFDSRIAQYIIEELANQGLQEDISLNDSLMAEIREKSELAKKSLSTVSQTSVILSFQGKQYRVKIERNTFEEITKDLLKTTEELTENALEEAKISWREIDHLLLIGGSTRMPMVENMICRISGKQPERKINPDEAVALGAAVKAYMELQAKGESQNGTVIDITISDVTSQALGVIMLNDNQKDENFIVIPRNAKIPTKGKQEALTVVENQRVINVQVTQGEDTDVNYVTIIGSKELPIPPYPLGAPFTVSYAYDEDQVVFVELYDATANKSIGTFEIDRSFNMNKEQLSNSIRRIGNIDV